MWRVVIFLLGLWPVVTAEAQEMKVVREHRQQKFPDVIAAGNYSGITAIGDERYAVVSDKSAEDGFYVFRIVLDSVTGKIARVENEGFRSSGKRNRDLEGIAYVKDTGTLFLSGETGNEIREYRLDGQQTGRQLEVPEVYQRAQGNLGFEALTYDEEQRLLWMVNEGPLKGDAADELRLQSFGLDGKPVGQWLYPMEAQQAKRPLVCGVSALCAIGDGQLLVLEREVKLTKLRVGSWVHCRLFVVRPAGDPAGTGSRLEKRLVTEWRTKISLTRRNFANYEGMCLGPRLNDGSRTLLLIADSQDQHAGILRDWLKVIVFGK